MGKTVKTWRVLKATGLKVGDSHRQRGDFVPEAKNWPSLRANINAEFIEEVHVDEDVIAENLAEVKERNKPKKKKVAKKKVTNSSKRVKVKKGSGDGERPELVEQAI